MIYIYVTNCKQDVDDFFQLSWGEKPKQNKKPIPI